jgi:hypothetical protein
MNKGEKFPPEFSASLFTLTLPSPSRERENCGKFSGANPGAIFSLSTR